MNEALEKVNVNLVRSASNILATNMLMNCDKTTPKPSPTIREISPIKRVSISKIVDIFLLLIPRVR